MRHDDPRADEACAECPHTGRSHFTDQDGPYCTGFVRNETTGMLSPDDCPCGSTQFLGWRGPDDRDE